MSAIACCCLAGLSGHAQGTSQQLLEHQSVRFEAKLEQAVDELEILNQEIAGEKEPLFVELNRLRSEVISERFATDELLISKEERRQALALARSDTEDSATHLEYVDSLLGNYTRNFELRIDIAEDQRYQAELTQSRMAIGRNDTVLSERVLESRFQILDMAVDRLEGLLGGDRYEGEAVGKTGELMKGEFALFGPLSLFLSDDQRLCGTPKLVANNPYPVVAGSSSYDASAVARFLASGEAIIGLDSSLGKAASIESARWSFKDHIQKGGYVGYAIIAFAAVVLLIALVKLWDFKRVGKTGQRSFSELFRLVREEKDSQAISQAETAEYPYDRVLVTALANRREEDEVMEEVVIGEIQKVKFRLERLLPFLAITAAATPLMGLLGTVVGMIKTFALITVFGSGEAKSLSSGISEALVTTEFGLLVAIPTLLIHGIFVRMSAERVAALEDFASDFVVGLKKLRGKRADD